jgi:hypothetical protein
MPGKPAHRRSTSSGSHTARPGATTTRKAASRGFVSARARKEAWAKSEVARAVRADWNGLRQLQNKVLHYTTLHCTTLHCTAPRYTLLLSLVVYISIVAL